jgi:pilus assembly protein CpaE
LVQGRRSTLRSAGVSAANLSEERKFIVAVDQAIRVAVITTPDQMDEDWLAQLAADPQIAWVEKSAVVSTGIDLVLQTRPDVVLVDRPIKETEQVIRQVFTSLPGTACIAMTSQGDMVVMRKLMLAGARDVLTRPVRHIDLMQSISEAASLESNRLALVPTGTSSRPRNRGKLVVLISPKGGAGTTFVSTNLAVMLRQITSSRVALVDFGLQFGHVGTHLNVFSRHTLQDLIERADDIDDALLSGVMQQHSSGVHLLLAPGSPDVAGEITHEQITATLDSLLDRYSYVIADTWSVLDEATMTLLERADEVLVVTTPEIPALKNVKYFLDYLKQHAVVDGQISIVLNRFPSVDGVSLEDVQQHLRHTVSANIPSAGQLVTYSVNRGVPIVLSHPDSWVGQSLRTLAAYVAGEQVNMISLAPEKGKSRNRAGRSAGQSRRGLFGSLRRQA